MSKRTRGNQRQSQRRPGTRPSPVRSNKPSRNDPELVADAGTNPPPDGAAVSVTPSGQASQTSTPPSKRVAPLATAAHHRVRAKPGSLLAARAATEYVYVSQDLRRIAIVAGVLFAILIALWLVLVIFGVSPLY